MKAPNEISVISINNKEDVLKTIELFNKIGINVFKDKLSKNWFILSEEEITKCFLISDNDGTGLYFPLYKADIDSSKTEDNNNYYFCDIDAVIDEMNEYEKDLNDLKSKFNKLFDTIIDIKNK